MNNNKILVLGGTGFVGRSVCERLAERNPATRIVVPTRRAQHGNSIIALPTVELLTADLHDDARLAQLVAGSDAVVNLVAILHGGREQFEQAHVALPRRLVQACKTAGVRRVVHVSALGAGPGGTSNYLRSKTAGEAVLASSGLDVTLLRPSVIFGAEDRFMNLFATLQMFAPFVPLAGSGARFQPVWVEDVASAIAKCLDDPGTIGKTYECTGPTQYSLSELVHLAGRWSGHERRQLPLSGGLAKLQALTMELLPGTPLMSRDNLESMRQPNVTGGTLPGLAALGIVPSALEGIAPAYLGESFACGRLNRWRAGAGR